MRKPKILEAPPARRAFGISETGEALGLSRATVWRLAKGGKLKTIKIGGRTLVPADEIDRLLAEGAA